MKAIRIVDTDNGTSADITDMEIADLSDGNVVIKSHYSSLNFKDALAITGKGKIARKRPLNAGIDVAGTVESSEDDRFAPGDEVIVTGWFLSETRDGGLAEYVRVPGDLCIARPDGLSLWETMALGTAGFTAGMAIKRMEDNFQKPDDGPVLVTGATGGVGMFAVDLLARRGYEVIAVSRKADSEGDALKKLGASDVITPDALDLEGKPLGKPVYAGAIDSVGGDLLAQIVAQIQPYGNVAAIGLAGGPKLATTVMPFILRGVSLVGIHSVECPQPWREQIWGDLSGQYKPAHLETIANETVAMAGVFEVCERIMAGENTGRTVVDIQG
ncbi:YhdH/YhfP family quinone oxidoreductase [Salinisphaera aquimarina]|uniref:YhdH/YhfP family quinone oxidoreductase n=1 Tax=Salinisphaera aquimarina TaxID=2094031 RepID=A0ABV7EPA8_9GAMM